MKIELVKLSPKEKREQCKALLKWQKAQKEIRDRWDGINKKISSMIILIRLEEERIELTKILKQNEFKKR